MARTKNGFNIKKIDEGEIIWLGKLNGEMYGARFIASGDFSKDLHTISDQCDFMKNQIIKLVTSGKSELSL